MPPRGCARPARSTIVSDTRNLLSRRQLLGAAMTVPLWRAVSHFPLAQGRGLDAIRDARGLVVGAGDADVSKVVLTRDWTDDTCRPSATNRGPRAVACREVVL